MFIQHFVLLHLQMLAENSCNRDEEMKFLRNILEQRFNSSTVQKHAKRRNQCDQIIPGLYLGDWYVEHNLCYQIPLLYEHTL